MTGKQKCEILKQIRREIAEANGIIHLTSECPYKGDCDGTCPRCDAEIRYLDSELNRLAAQGKKITIAGLSVSPLLESLGKQEKINNKNDCNNTQECDSLNDRYNIDLTERREECISPNKIMSMPIEEADFSTRTFICLKNAGIDTVHDLTEQTEADIIKIRYLGKCGLKEVLTKLANFGLQLKAKGE